MTGFGLQGNNYLNNTCTFFKNKLTVDTLVTQGIYKHAMFI